MRAFLAIALLVLAGSRAPAQAGSASGGVTGSGASGSTGPTRPPQPAPRQNTSSSIAGAQDSAIAAVAAEIERQRSATGRRIPNAQLFTLGDRIIPPDTTLVGPVAVAGGSLDVFGTVDGDAVTLDGDIRVHPGGRIIGDAWAVSGSVIVQGGAINGTMRSIAMSPVAAPAPTPPQPATRLSTLDSVKLVLACFALLAIIGIGVMVFAEQNLDGVVMALEQGFARSFWIGVAGQIALLPALLVLVVALAITILGILLIPFAIVTYVIAVAGLVTLGLLAVARLTGRALASDRGTASARGVHLRALVIGLVTYLCIWLIAAVFAWSPIVGAILRAVAIAVTWVAATVGLGAALASRAGTRRQKHGGQPSDGADDYAWQTPTPVTGVAASTRRVKAGAST